MSGTGRTPAARAGPAAVPPTSTPSGRTSTGSTPSRWSGPAGLFPAPTRALGRAKRPLIPPQPPQPGEMAAAPPAAVTPAARLALALAAVHAARPKAIRELHLDDVDVGNRRLAITGRIRPLDDLTRRLLLGWHEHRRDRWPGTANPHLIINQQTAMTTPPLTA